MTTVPARVERSGSCGANLVTNSQQESKPMKLLSPAHFTSLFDKICPCGSGRKKVGAVMPTQEPLRLTLAGTLLLLLVVCGAAGSEGRLATTGFISSNNIF